MAVVGIAFAVLVSMAIGIPAVNAFEKWKKEMDYDPSDKE